MDIQIELIIHIWMERMYTVPSYIHIYYIGDRIYVYVWIYSIERNYKDVDGHCMCVQSKDRGNKKYMYRYIDRNNKDVDGGCTVCTLDIGNRK